MSAADLLDEAVSLREREEAAHRLADTRLKKVLTIALAALWTAAAAGNVTCRKAVFEIHPLLRPKTKPTSTSTSK